MTFSNTFFIQQNFHVPVLYIVLLQERMSCHITIFGKNTVIEQESQHNDEDADNAFSSGGEKWLGLSQLCQHNFRHNRGKRHKA